MFAAAGWPWMPAARKGLLEPARAVGYSPGMPDSHHGVLPITKGAGTGPEPLDPLASGVSECARTMDGNCLLVLAEFEAERSAR
jgi:hypothetical protein